MLQARNMRVFSRRNGRAWSDYKRRWATVSKAGNIQAEAAVIDNGPRVPQFKPAIRTRQRNTHIPLPPKPRSSLLASSLSGQAYPPIPPLSRQLRRVSPYLLLPRFWLRRHNPQNLGLGTRRARAHLERAHKTCSELRFWGSTRRYTTRLLLFRPHNQTLGSLRRIQEYPDTTRP